MEPQPTDETFPAEVIDLDDHSFEVAAVSALYTGSERGLQADLLAARALGGAAIPICTAMVIASHGQVTDVVDVPSDTVRAQLGHTFDTTDPDGVKISIVPHPHTIEAVFELLEGRDFPIIFDPTASGPTGETLLTGRGIDAVIDHLAHADLVTVRRTDAELLVQMEINSLDDAQVAAQRFAQRGAPNVLLRCGRIPRQHFESEDAAPDYAVDLFYDGSEFGVFEAPFLPRTNVRGASSALSMALLRELTRKDSLIDALQTAKVYVTQTIRYAQTIGSVERPDYFWFRTPDNSSSGQ